MAIVGDGQDTVVDLISRLHLARAHMKVAVEIAAKVHPSNTRMNIPSPETGYSIDMAAANLERALKALDPDFASYGAVIAKKD